MAFNPLDEKGIPMEKQVHPWADLNVEPYRAKNVHPYTRTRIIAMNGIEVEAAIFMHQFNRHTVNPEIKKELAMVRRIEQQQQKVVNWLIPATESVLELTLGYEQVAIDLTAWLARTEPDPYVKQALDFALLEDFDHLYRYANLYTMDTGQDPADIVGDYTEIMPGRPTIAEHRHPHDSLTMHYDDESADILTKLHVLTIVPAEQQTMNFYMNAGNRYETMLGRGLFQEIAMIEEQHVSHYECLADPTVPWLDRMLMHEYNECYLYYSCMETETDPRIKKIWEHHLDMEIAHLHGAIDLIKKFEGRDATEMLPAHFPELVVFQSNKEYIREVIKKEVELTKDGKEFVHVGELPQDHRYFQYQKMVNDGGVPSQDVIEQHIEQKRQDFRIETEGDHPFAPLQDRSSVDDQIARAA